MDPGPDARTLKVLEEGSTTLADKPMKHSFLEDIPFYNQQVKIFCATTGYIDPTSIEEYIAVGGYTALEKALFDMKPKKSSKKSKNRVCGAAAAADSHRHQMGNLSPAKRGQVHHLQCG